MASNPITSWQVDGEEVETLTDFIFLGSKITVNGDCSHKIKRHLLLGRNAMTNPDSVLKTETSLCQQSTYSQNYGFSSENDSHSVVSNSLRTMDYTAHGILQARILEWVAFPFSRGSS